MSMAQVWKIAPGQHADHWEMCREKSCILIGWSALKDYRKFNSEKAVLRALPGGWGDGAGAAKSIWRFTHEIKPSHIVIANKGRSSVVGIGIVESEYLPPGSPKNPSRSESLPNARLVKWVVDQPLDLGPYFFGMPTVTSLGAKKVSEIKRAYLKTYPKLKKTLDCLFDRALADETYNSATNELLASAKRQLAEEGAFNPAGIKDARERILSSLVQRQGQPAFRKHLLAAYNGRCAITGCGVEAVLEAAHIVPYKGSKTNHEGNGLLLRADLHTLFDLRLVAVDVETMRLLVSPELDSTGYEKYRGKQIRVPKELPSQPSREALEQHRRESGLTC